MRTSIRLKFVTVLGLLALTVISSGIGAVYVLRSNETSLQDLQSRRLRSLLLARDAQALFRRYLKDAEVAISTSERQVLADDASVVADLHTKLADLRQLNGQPSGALDTELDAFTRRTSDYLDLTHAAAAEDTNVVAVGEEIGHLRGGILAELVGLEREATQQFDQSVHEISAFNEHAVTFYLIALGSLTACALAIAAAILATVLRRIRVLGQHFAATDLEKITPLPMTGRRDELNDLVAAANRMLLGFNNSRQQLVDKNLLDSVIEALPDLLFVVDGAGRIIRANGVSDGLTGRAPSSFEGELLVRHLVANERTEKGGVEAVVAEVAAGRALRDSVSLLGASNAAIPVEITGVPLAGERKGSARGVFVIHDLRQKLADELRVRDIQSQLVQASKLASLGTLGAGVAHELNNPLAAVRGYAELLGTTPGVTPRMQDLSEKIVKASDRMRKIIDHLRIFSTDTSKRQMGTVDVNTVVRDSLILLQNQIAQSGVEIKVDLTTAALPVKGDANQLESIIQNLITNARDALLDVKDGRPRYIAVSSQYNSTLGLIVTVADNADGIPESAQGRVFDPFFTTKQIGKGTGLGLSIAHSIARDHGGNLVFATAAGKGTTFTLCLPAASVDTAQGGEADFTLPPLSDSAAAVATTLLRPSVLIVDDEEMIGEVLELSLGDAFLVERFNDPIKAVARAAEREFDLIITDMAMPGIDGMELIKRVLAQRADTKIVVITGHARSGAIQKAILDLGALDILPKPFPPGDELCQKLLAVINGALPSKAA